MARVATLLLCVAGDEVMTLPLTQLQAIFSAQFFATHRTCLLGGFDEPFYRAPTATSEGQVQYRLDYLSSALHELAHWCLAGPQRLQQDDYGYSYQSERDLSAQLDFERLEARTQALEWLLHLACGQKFRPSADNLSLPDYDLRPFARRIEQQAAQMLNGHLPPRGHQLILALHQQHPGSAWAQAATRVAGGVFNDNL